MVDLLPDDILQIREVTIARFGELEWEKAVLTNTVHGHLGIYSILGVKMGIRALELFDADSSHPSLNIVSHAGTTPPLSCLNDGLQISTGSTLGRGLISVSRCPLKAPKASFTSEGKTITLSLKPEFSAQIENDIKRATELFGRSQAYWESIRKTALHYWSNWDRRVLFNTLSK